MTNKSNDLAISSEPTAQISPHPGSGGSEVVSLFACKKAIDEICALNWEGLTQDDLMGVAGAYYYFSIQFRENLEIACNLYPTDPLLTQLAQEECNTDNLSPWPGVASPGEKLDHDEFMRRLLKLSPVCRAT